MKLSRNINRQFMEVVSMIKQARCTAVKSVNAEQIKLYWQVGEDISKKLESAQWGEGIVDGLADYIQSTMPEFKGFTRRGLYRMRQFYETYRRGQIVSPLVTQLSWTNHLIILSKTKSMEEKDRQLRCLVMLELKINEFKPEYLGKLNFYLEALDRDVKKPYENPSVGIILCKSKDDEVVEYALSRNLSPALVAEYKTQLIPKKVLERKLHEYALLAESKKSKSI